MPKSPLARLLPHLGRLGRATRWRRTKGRPRVWAHRGDSAHEPENTMRAFERALAVGADGIELDVRLDAEANVVVFHDSPLERLTGLPGRLETRICWARRVISSAARRVNVNSNKRRGSAPPRISRATRCASVLVLPVPAPAAINSGPAGPPAATMP